MNDDSTLLRRYTKEGSEEAFTDLVHRYIDLVYAGAMRRTHGNAHLAREVVQHVFTSLARNAKRLAPDSVLGAWLHTATRNASIKLMIQEQRRRERETAAAELAAAGTKDRAHLDWEELRPLLDSAIDELPEPDRATLVLRFFERRAFASMGAALHISEDAARMRTDRALDRLRAALARRGITSTAGALAATISSQPLISAPAGLALTLASEALSIVGAAAGSTALFSIMTAKIVTTAFVSSVIAFMIGSYVGGTTTSDVTPSTVLDTDTPRFAATIASLRADNRLLKDQVSASVADLAALRDANASLEAQRAALRTKAAAAVRKSPNIGLPRHELQEAVLNNLRQIAAARDQYVLEHGRAPESVEALVGSRAYIRTLRTVGGEDYAELAMANSGPLTTTTPDGIAVTYDPTGQTTTKPDVPPEIARMQALKKRVEPAINQAVAAYRAANNGSNPTSEKALLPYFNTPQEGADFVEYVEASKPVSKP